MFTFLVEMSVTGRRLQIAGILHRRWSGDESTEDARDQRIRAQAVGSVILIFALTCRINSRNIGCLIEIDPQPTHGVVHAGENFHGDLARVIAYKLLINLENAFELAVENLGVDVSQVKIDHGLPVDAQVVL